MTENSSSGMYLIHGLAAGLVTVIVVGVPTDIIDTPFFGREVPVRWWEYPVLAATAALTALWFGIRPSPQERRPTGAAAGVMLAVFAVGCPVCNKIVLLALGTSGALGFWAPLQPVLAVLSLVLLTTAVVLRRRRSLCGPACTAPAERSGTGQPPKIAQEAASAATTAENVASTGSADRASASG
ncbi:hypothetical protein [Rhodococcus sp. AG1013]|uniref:hypothetical protein n=1 Tax=Rhodococcus sp. AG1013 TaxID=2183996 RepID=UPI00215DB0AC|nr:hypothetical protein [Rhodococcus sp. AG1013]